MRILPGLYRIPGKVANAFLLVDGEELTLIDTDLPRHARHILATISRLGFEPRQLKRILITHADGDHVGGLAALRAASGARVLAHPLEAEAIARGDTSRPLRPPFWMRPLLALSAPFFRVPPQPVDEHLEDGQVLPVLGGLQVMATPGHTPGHLSFYLPQQGVLFVGDSFRAFRGRLRVSGGMNTWDERLALESARKQADVHPRLLCPGHGPVIADAEAAIRRCLAEGEAG